MENAVNRLPKKITEGVKATCNRCGQDIYSEWSETCGITGKITKFFVGAYSQDITDGTDNSPYIPFCKCERK